MYFSGDCMKKPSDTSESFPLAVLLTLSGGLMDAYSYMCRDQVFANAQTGNLILFGVHLIEGNILSSLRYLLPVIAFALGISAAEFFMRFVGDKKRIHWRQLTLLAEAVFLFIVAFIPQSLNPLANSLISFACGAQVESFRTLGGSSIATTMCIGNLRAATQSLCDYRFTHDRSARENGALYLSLVGIFVTGAVAGNLLVKFIGEFAIFGSVVLLLSAFMLMHSKKEN
jgi:Predicted membrane protein